MSDRGGSSSAVLTDHAAWVPFEDGYRRVFASPEGGRYLYVVKGQESQIAQLAGGEEPVGDTFSFPSGMLDEVPKLADELRNLGTVTRFRNTDLWSALGTSIIRQVIRAGQAKKLYRSFCEAHGESIQLQNGDSYALFPKPETVLELNENQFSSIGLAFHRRSLVGAAEAYLELGETWRRVSPKVLITELQKVPRIGPWTAQATVADWSNDWALYPYADLAVRTWAHRAAAPYEWPTDEAAFGKIWRRLTEDHLSTITLLTLAWGSRHGDTD